MGPGGASPSTTAFTRSGSMISSAAPATFASPAHASGSSEPLWSA